jgi:hypothetical protein
VKALNFLSGIAALLAAYWWYRSARIKTPDEFPIQVFSDAPFSAEIPPASIETVGTSPQLDAIGKALIAQSGLSARAALCAAISAVIQVVVLAL